MKKLKWKKAKVELCTTFRKVHIVDGYECGFLAIHKIPESDDKRSAKDPNWTITHIKTGLGIWCQCQPPFRTLVEAKDFAGKLMNGDTWFIEGAKFGDTGNTGRVNELAKKFIEALTEEGYKKDTRKHSHDDKSKEIYKCDDCGRIADRYILSLDRKKKWVHRCLECEPHDNERKGL
jgi:hypothetical protein